MPPESSVLSAVRSDHSISSNGMMPEVAKVGCKVRPLLEAAACGAVSGFIVLGDSAVAGGGTDMTEWFSSGWFMIGLIDSISCE